MSRTNDTIQVGIRGTSTFTSGFTIIIIIITIIEIEKIEKIENEIGRIDINIDVDMIDTPTTTPSPTTSFTISTYLGI